MLARLVIPDRAVAVAADGGAGGPRQRHREALIRLHDPVARDVDRDRLAGLAGREATVPDGKAAPTKSDPVAGLAPLPVTAQLALLAMLVSPPRVTVKVNGVLAPVVP